MEYNDDFRSVCLRKMLGILDFGMYIVSGHYKSWVNLSTCRIKYAVLGCNVPWLPGSTDLEISQGHNHDKNYTSS